MESENFLFFDTSMELWAVFLGLCLCNFCWKHYWHHNNLAL